MGDPFVHLHVASGFSLRHGASPPAALVERALEHEMDTLALTDRDGTYGAVRFAKACLSAGIKPVLGVDLALAPTGLVPGPGRGAGRRTARPGRRRGARRAGVPSATCGCRGSPSWPPTAPAGPRSAGSSPPPTSPGSGASRSAPSTSSPSTPPAAGCWPCSARRPRSARPSPRSAPTSAGPCSTGGASCSAPPTWWWSWSTTGSRATGRPRPPTPPGWPGWPPRPGSAWCSATPSATPTAPTP